MLTTPALTLLFLCIVVSLGTAFVWVFWEHEQMMSKQTMSRADRNRDRFG